MYIHIGVGSDVVCSTSIGNARASVRGMGNRTIPRFFVYVHLRMKHTMKETDMNALPNAAVSPVTTTQKVDDAVGVQKRCWFVAIVNNKTERQCAKKLEKLGYECYVPTQKETHVWRTGVKKIIERVVLPSMIFIHTTEAERKHHIVALPYINRFMTNRAGSKGKFGKYPIAVIPDDQIQRLKFILGHTDAPIEFEQTTFSLGDKVRVIRGSLAGAEGYIIECFDATYFAIRVGFLGVAKVRISHKDLELIKY